jgi:glycerol-1-phosphate dehydrogenase [NAD(P)+]
MAGLGDLLATYTAPADWLLAHFVGQTTATRRSRCSRAHVDTVLDRADAIHRGDPDALENLTASSPSAGSRWAWPATPRRARDGGNVSHLLEMAERPGAPAPLHRAKVGALAVLAAMLWARADRGARRQAALAALPERRGDGAARARRVATLDPTGQMGQECWRAYSRSSSAGTRHARRWPLWERWPRSTSSSTACCPPERPSPATRRPRAPAAGPLGVRDTTARWALARGT